MLKLKFLGRLKEIGFLMLRVGVGVSFIVHGSGKMFHPEMWPTLGGAMAAWGISYAPTFWGFMAAFAEFGGGILFTLGFLFRPACLLMAFTMAVALSFHLAKGDDFGVYSHAMELLFVFLGMAFMGPGKLSLDGE